MPKEAKDLRTLRLAQPRTERTLGMVGHPAAVGQPALGLVHFTYLLTARSEGTGNSAKGPLERGPELQGGRRHERVFGGHDSPCLRLLERNPDLQRPRS